MPYLPDIAIIPGKTLLRVLESEGMTQKNLSERTGLSEKHISQIVNGEASITVETALLLENALGGNAAFWLNIEKNFQETKARVEKNASLSNETHLLIKYPYLELVKRGFVEQTSNSLKKVENLWKFFGVNSLSQIALTEAVAFRKREHENIKSESIAAWLRCGEIEAKRLVLPEFSKTKLREVLNDLKGLTLQPVEVFSVEAKEKLSEAGVALVYVKHFPGTGVSGAVRWIGDVPVIQLSLLFSYADIFWFNLFHEIGHIFLHGKKEKFIEFNKSSSSNEEKAADEFATNSLVDLAEYYKFSDREEFTRVAIKDFARKNNIHPGIIAGRLCHEGKAKWQDVNSLRVRLKFVK